jgi:hypothetical protein
MAGDDTVGPKPTDKSEWSSAWKVVSRLAATQQHPDADHSLMDSRSLRAECVGSRNDVASLDQVQLAAAVADIKRASAALQRSQPALEYGRALAPSRRKQRNYWSVWVIIAVIWISAILVVASAAGAILYWLR